LQYLTSPEHLSGRELADKLVRGMDHIHAWRVEMLTRLGEPENGRR
jgi:integrase/recombinase XerD